MCISPPNLSPTHSHPHNSDRRWNWVELLIITCFFDLQRLYKPCKKESKAMILNIHNGWISRVVCSSEVIHSLYNSWISYVTQKNNWLFVFFIHPPFFWASEESKFCSRVTVWTRRSTVSHNNETNEIHIAGGHIAIYKRWNMFGQHWSNKEQWLMSL